MERTTDFLLITDYWYFLQINKEKMLQMQGNDKSIVIGLVTRQSLRELAQTSGTQGDGVLARASHRAV